MSCLFVPLLCLYAISVIIQLDGGGLSIHSTTRTVKERDFRARSLFLLNESKNGMRINHVCNSARKPPANLTKMSVDRKCTLPQDSPTGNPFGRRTTVASPAAAVGFRGRKRTVTFFDLHYFERLSKRIVDQRSVGDDHSSYRGAVANAMEKAQPFIALYSFWCHCAAHS